jgi:hypothetical protein
MARRERRLSEVVDDVSFSNCEVRQSNKSRPGLRRYLRFDFFQSWRIVLVVSFFVSNKYFTLSILDNRYSHEYYLETCSARTLVEPGL